MQKVGVEQCNDRRLEACARRHAKEQKSVRTCVESGVEPGSSMWVRDLLGAAGR